MHISGKILIPLGVLSLILGIVWMVVGPEDDFVIEDSTEGTVELHDDDDKGEIGFTFWIEGSYEDSDENGMWDDCEDFNATFTGPDGVERDYFLLVCDEGLRDDGNEIPREFEDQGLIYVGIACSMEYLDQDCEDGEYSITTNTPANVRYEDEVIWGGIVWLAGLCCMICGLLLGGIGLLLGLLIKPSTPPVMIVQGQPEMTDVPVLGQQPAFSAPEGGGDVTAEPAEEPAEEPAFDLSKLTLDDD